MPLKIVSGLPVGASLAVLQLVANDLVVDLGVEPILVEPDARAAVGALRDGRAKADVHVGLACAFRVLERDQESARRRRVVAVIDAAPGVDVNGAVGRHGELTCVTNLVGKDRRAESVRQTQILVGVSGHFFSSLRTVGELARQIARETRPATTTAAVKDRNFIAQLLACPVVN